jgi:hypothetical protein
MSQNGRGPTGQGRLRIDPYQIFLALMLGGLGLMTMAMLAIAIWLFRRNRRLPHLVKRRRRHP